MLPSPPRTLRALVLWGVIITPIITQAACSALAPPAPPPPPAPHPNLERAEASFKKGDWEGLKELVKTLPSSGVGADEGLFYHAVTQGLSYRPEVGLKLGMKALKGLEGRGSVELRERVARYQLIFQALSGGCMLAMGPLKALHAPRLDELPEGTRGLLQRALKACDESRSALSQRLKASALKASKIQKDQQTSTPQEADAESREPVEVADQASQPPALLPILTRAQREGVTPHIALLLPRAEGQKKRARFAQQLLEVAPLAVSHSERLGLPLKVELFEPEGTEALNTSVLSLPASAQVIIAFTLSKSSQEALIEATRAQARPLILMSPHALSLKEDDNVWRLFSTPELIAEELISDAQRAQAERVAVVTPEGRWGAQISEHVERSVKGLGLTWRGRERAPKHLDDVKGWQALAARISDLPIDTLVLALSPSKAAQLSTYLAAEGVWSASPERFEQRLPHLTAPRDTKEKRQERALRLYLWPSAYQQSALKQAGRYLEGARTVSPVAREHEAFQRLSEELKEEVKRSAELLDPLLIAIIEALDEPLRVSLALSRPLDPLLPKAQRDADAIPALSFEHPELMRSLMRLEVRAQRFELLPAPLSQPNPQSPQEGAP